MRQDLDDALRWAHHANIERYRRLLKTDLTTNEREFIEQRIAEEQKALLQITLKDESPDSSVA